VSIVGTSEILIWSLRIVPFSQANTSTTINSQSWIESSPLVAKERTDKKERKNEKRKAQLENFKNRKKLKLATDTQQLQE
jgi:hypothetical protein